MEEKFEKGIIEYLKVHSSADLYVLSDFYDVCCDLLGLDIALNIRNYKKYKRKIYYRLNLMVKNGLIRKHRIGTGFLGKTDFGMTSINIYTLENF